jgi:signal transduction histidine kinase
VKNRIFKSFTHELKSPLNFIMMSYELIYLHLKSLGIRKGSNKVYKKLVNVVEIQEACATNLKCKINDYMDYSLLCTNSGEFQLEKKEFDFEKFLKKIEKTISRQLKNPNVIFRVVKDDVLPELLYTDPAKLE